MSESIAAVVVTYQRKELLVECLLGILKQSKPVNSIYLIDNDSRDGTPDFLKVHNFLESLPPVQGTLWESKTKLFNSYCILNFVRLAENTGGAGGFHEGVKRAYESGFQWIWLLDDDVEPEKFCLENLLSFQDVSKCIHPQKILPDGKLLNWEGYISPVTGRRIFQNNPSFERGFQFSCTNAGNFEGMLIHRDIVKEIGYPDPRFFMVSDDSVYGFLAHFHTPVLYANKPRIFKKIYLPWFPVSDRFLYYSMRNYFLRNSYLNLKYKKYKAIRYLFIFVFFLNYFIRILTLGGDKKNKHLLILFRGFKDGFLGKFGRVL